jgi:hypothetical protein
MNGLVKTMDDGSDGKIKLVGNAMTFILYKSYFRRDLLNDLVIFVQKARMRKRWLGSARSKLGRRTIYRL